MEHGDGGRASQGVPAKPCEELQNIAKNIANCTELHLARRGITHFNDDMEAFKSLEVLWINDNSFSRVTNLDFNPTIKSLYAHNNRIRSLKGSLLAFTFLHTLTLGNNCIDNLQGNLEILRLMRHLRYLELSGNPLAEETGYRLLVVKHLPWLETLDMHKITDQERIDARRIRLPKSWQVSEQGGHGDSVRHTQDLAAKETKTERWEGRRGSISVPFPVVTLDMRRKQAMIKKELTRIRGIVKQRRILLKEWFTMDDPRRERVVTQLAFTRCLRQHGLWPPGRETKRSNLKRARGNSSSDGGTASSSKDFLKGEAGLLAGVLLEAFRVPTPARAPFLGRDREYLEQGFVDYVSFCGAVEPKCGGRDMDNKERELEKAWRKKTADKNVRRTSDRKQVIAAGKRRSSGGGGGNHGVEGLDADCHKPALAVRAPMAWESTMNKSQNAGGVNQLDHWERIELRRALEAQAADGAAATTAKLITRAQVVSGLKSMLIRGRRALIFEIEVATSIDEDSLNQLSAASGGTGNNANSISAALTSVGSNDRPTNLDVLFDAAAAVLEPILASSGGGRGIGGVSGDGGQEERKADIGVLMQTLETGVSGPGGVGPLEWEVLSREDAADGAKRLYREAAHAQRRMLLIYDEEDDTVRQEASRIRQNIAALTKDAALLETLASSSTHSSKRTTATTATTAAAAAADDEEGELLGFSNARGPPHHRRRNISTAGQQQQQLYKYKKLPSLGRVDVFFATEFHGGPFQQQGNDSHNDSDAAAGYGRYGGDGGGGGSSSTSKLCPVASLGGFEFEPSVGVTSHGKGARKLASAHSHAGAFVTSARRSAGGRRERGGGGGGQRRLVGGPAEGTAGRVWCTRRVMTAG